MDLDNRHPFEMEKSEDSDKETKNRIHVSKSQNQFPSSTTNIGLSPVQWIGLYRVFNIGLGELYIWKKYRACSTHTIPNQIKNLQILDRANAGDKLTNKTHTCVMIMSKHLQPKYAWARDLH